MPSLKYYFILLFKTLSLLLIKIYNYTTSLKYIKRYGRLIHYYYLKLKLLLIVL